MAYNWQSEGTDQLIVNGLALECASWGPPPSEAPTIVLLHEGLGCVALWRDFPERLVAATGHGVFAYSRGGYGASDPIALPRPLDYMTREATQVLPQVLDQVCARRCVLLGHSDGASIAAIHAGSVPDPRVRGLVLIAPHFFTEDVGLAAIEDAKDAYETGPLRSRLARYHRHVDVAFRGWNDAWLDPAFRDWNIAECIEHWRVPTLFLQGEQDQYGTLAQLHEAQDRADIPVEVAVFDACGHAPHLEQADKTSDAIRAFLRRIERIEDADPQS